MTLLQCARWTELQKYSKNIKQLNYHNVRDDNFKHLLLRSHFLLQTGGQLQASPFIHMIFLTNTVDLCPVRATEDISEILVTVLHQKDTLVWEAKCCKLQEIQGKKGLYRNSLIKPWHCQNCVTNTMVHTRDSSFTSSNILS